jgi:hypothetical protein
MTPSGPEEDFRFERSKVRLNLIEREQKGEISVKRETSGAGSTLVKSLWVGILPSLSASSLFDSLAILRTGIARS